MFVVYGSLSAGGPLPAPCVHTCERHHLHLSSLYRLTCDCVSQWRCRAQGEPNGHTRVSQASQTRDLERVSRAEWWGYGVVRVMSGGVMSSDPHHACLPTLQRQCSLGISLPLLTPLRL